MTWRWPGVKPLSEPMMVSLLTCICVTRPQLINNDLAHWDILLSIGIYLGLNITVASQKHQGLLQVNSKKKHNKNRNWLHQLLAVTVSPYGSSDTFPSSKDQWLMASELIQVRHAMATFDNNNCNIKPAQILRIGHSVHALQYFHIYNITRSNSQN